MRKYCTFFVSALFILASATLFAQENRTLVSGVPYPVFGENTKTFTPPSRFEMGQNSPNPFSYYTQIEYSNPSQGFVEFKIVNLIGKEIYHRAVEADAGRNFIRFESEDINPGVYIYSLSNGSQTITRRMVISKK